MRNEELEILISFLIDFFNKTSFIIIYYQSFNLNEISFLYITNKFYSISCKRVSFTRFILFFINVKRVDVIIIILSYLRNAHIQQSLYAYSFRLDN